MHRCAGVFGISKGTALPRSSSKLLRLELHRLVLQELLEPVDAGLATDAGLLVTAEWHVWIESPAIMSILQS